MWMMSCPAEHSVAEEIKTVCGTFASVADTQKKLYRFHFLMIWIETLKYILYINCRYSHAINLNEGIK